MTFSEHRPVLVKIHPEHVGQRIDNYLIGYLKGVPKSHIYRILRKGEVRVNKGRKKAHYRLQHDDVIRIPPIRVAEKPPQVSASTQLRERLLTAIVYEDDAVMVVNKPAGMAVHGGSGIQLGLIEAMRDIRSDIHNLELVHRLDRETSGCLLLAKKRSALRGLHNELRENQWRKSYLCLVQGEFQGKKRQIDVPLLKNVLASGERVVRVHHDGKFALTKFTRITSQPEWSLLRADLVTGRTHQIRVHCQHMGHPIAGDERYGDKDFNTWARSRGLRRMFLHALRLQFRSPAGGELVNVLADPDPMLSEFLDELGWKGEFESL